MSRVTALEFINAHDVTLLMAGSDDGSVRVWKNYNSALNRDPVLLTAWQALADIQPTTKATTGAYSVLSHFNKSLCLEVECVN